MARAVPRTVFFVLVLSNFPKCSNILQRIVGHHFSNLSNFLQKIVGHHFPNFSNILQRIVGHHFFNCSNFSNNLQRIVGHHLFSFSNILNKILVPKRFFGECWKSWKNDAQRFFAECWTSLKSSKNDAQRFFAECWKSWTSWKNDAQSFSPTINMCCRVCFCIIIYKCNSFACTSWSVVYCRVVKKQGGIVQHPCICIESERLMYLYNTCYRATHYWV